MHWTLERKIAVSYAVALALLSIVGAATWTSLARFERAFGRVEHTHTVLNHLEQIQVHALEIQTGSRGFALSGDAAFLDSFDLGVAKIREYIAAARELTSDNPTQQHRLERLQFLADREIALMSRRNEARRTEGLSAGLDTATLRESKLVMDELRTLIGEMGQTENNLLAERALAARRSAAHTRTALLLAIALMFVLAGAAGTRVQQEFAARRRADAALQRSADRIRDLYNRAPCGYHSLDAAGIVVEINDTELAWLGYTRDEVIGRLRFRDLLPPADQGKFAGAFPRFKATGTVDNLEFQLRRRDGSTFHVSLSATALYDADGRYLSSRSTVHNIDARRAAEQRLAALHRELQEHSARVEDANRELEAFSYSVSHDLRAPLRHLAGFSALLLERERARLDAESLRYVETIVASARRMSELIDALLDFARLGRLPLRHARVDSRALVDEVLAEKHFDAAPQTEWRIGPLPAVEADPALLRQVWTNLLANAAKYSARSRPPRIQVAAESSPDGREATFAVRDNGVGFDPRYTDKLFKVFSRLHGDREFRGTGIGLALVQRIVTRHGGRVWAEGAPGAGATFFFTLPTASPP